MEENNNEAKKLFDEFQNIWNLEKVKNMTLEEYTNIGNNRDDFTYWLEHKLKILGSIKGNFSHTFGVYRRKSNDDKVNQRGLMYSDKYAWRQKYGNSENEAFEKVKNLILQVIKDSQNNNLEAIDLIDLGDLLKWKIAFHYQNPNDMKIFCIFSDNTLNKIASGELGKSKLKTYKIYPQILENLLKVKPYKFDKVFSASKDLWKKYNAKEGQDNQFATNKVLNQNTGENMKTIPPLNQILYGPPGTGKTYNTINKALEVLGEQIEGKDRAELKAKFDEYRQNGQIEFVTFHQSFSYEEFVEGIKPNTDNPTNMIYEPKAGIFKEICKSALANLQDSQNTKEILQDKENFENKLDEFLSDLVENQITIEKSNVGSFQISGFDDDKIYISTQDTKISLSLYMDFLKKVLQSGESFDTSKEMMLKIANKKNQWQSSTYYFQLYKLFKDFKPSKIAQNVDKVILKPYILIIDEINRGNISKILGELITLIEPSKRIGANDEDKARGIGNESLEVTLPYSNDSFGVPSNLYIIGTMNTADRSIALLDTALRRRFEFVEMMPNAELLEKIKVENSEIDLQKLLTKMNERIEFLLDREHTIGHSFFIGVDSLDRLCEVFKLKIIPLLQEYFYDDYAKIDAVLNGNGIVVSKSMSDLGVRLSEYFVDSEKRVYRITESSAWNATTFTKIYE